VQRFHLLAGTLLKNQSSDEESKRS